MTVKEECLIQITCVNKSSKLDVCNSVFILVLVE